MNESPEQPAPVRAVDDERDGSEPRTGLARVLPIWGWAPHYRRSWLRPDLIAGLTVAALVVPKALGYAGIAEVPIQYGLYAAAAGTILYALLCTSRQISTGPSAALSAVAAGAVLGAAASGQQAITMVASITFVSGVLFAVLAVFKMGWISNFLSKAVIVGFLFGAGIQTTIGELAKITGTEASGDNSWQKAASWIGSLADTHGATVVVGVVALIVIFGLRFLAPKIPARLSSSWAACWPLRSSASRPAVWRSSATSPAAFPPSSSPTSATSPTTSRTCSRPRSRCS